MVEPLGFVPFDKLKFVGLFKDETTCIEQSFPVTLVSLHQKSRVCSTEPKGIRQHISYWNAPRSVRYIIEIAFGVRIFVVDGRRNYLIVQCQRADSGFFSSSRPKQMTHHRLR